MRNLIGSLVVLGMLSGVWGTITYVYALKAAEEIRLRVDPQDEWRFVGISFTMFGLPPGSGPSWVVEYEPPYETVELPLIIVRLDRRVTTNPASLMKPVAPLPRDSAPDLNEPSKAQQDRTLDAASVH